MRRNIIYQAGRVLFLLLYSIYAVTPVHMYSIGAGPGSAYNLHRAGAHTVADIIWVNVLFFSPAEGDERSAPGIRSLGSSEEGDVVLVRRRRALGREQVDIKPVFSVTLLPGRVAEHTGYCPAKYETIKDPLLRKTEGCNNLNSGLSPPSVILS